MLVETCVSWKLCQLKVVSVESQVLVETCVSWNLCQLKVVSVESCVSWKLCQLKVRCQLKVVSVESQVLFESQVLEICRELVTCKVLCCSPWSPVQPPGQNNISVQFIQLYLQFGGFTFKTLRHCNFEVFKTFHHFNNKCWFAGKPGKLGKPGKCKSNQNLVTRGCETNSKIWENGQVEGAVKSVLFKGAVKFYFFCMSKSFSRRKSTEVLNINWC